MTIDLSKTINEQRNEWDNYDLFIWITFKGSGKTYFMNQIIKNEILLGNKKCIIMRLNELNIMKAVISPLIALLNSLNLHEKFKVDRIGLKNIETKEYKILFGYFSSPSSLDGCELKADYVFVDEFLKVEKRNTCTPAQVFEKYFFSAAGDIVKHFWRMVNTVTRPNRPKIYMFANPHTPTCLNNDLIYNKTLDWEINWDDLSNKKTVFAEKLIKLRGFEDFKCAICIVPIPFINMNTPSNELMEIMSGEEYFTFENNTKKVLYFWSNDYLIKNDYDIFLCVKYGISDYYTIWVNKKDDFYVMKGKHINPDTPVWVFKPEFMEDEAEFIDELNEDINNFCECLLDSHVKNKIKSQNMEIYYQAILQFIINKKWINNCGWNSFLKSYNGNG